jgi:hypothetical protein
MYTTTRVDESSTATQTRYSKLNILTKPDIIEVLDKENNVYLTINEDESTTNKTTVFKDPNSNSEWDFITTGVIHQIDKVLVKDSIQ